MEAEYDFSKAERGKFYRQNASIKSPVYLDDDIQTLMNQKAKEKGVDISKIVNEILRKELVTAP